MSERDYSNNPDDYWHDYPDGQHPGGVTPPTGPGPTPEPEIFPSTPAVPVKEATAVDHGIPTPQPPRQPSFQSPVDTTPSSYRPPGQEAPAQASYHTPAITDDITNILRARLKDLQNPGDVANDPIYQNAVKQYQIASLRGADRERKQLAERNAASGTRATGGFNVGVQGINERTGERNSQYASGLALDRLSAREQQLVQAIQIARSVGQDDIANQLELQRLQLQGELGRGDLALRGELGRGQLGLGQDQLGLSYADLITRANRDATLAALGGG